MVEQVNQHAAGYAGQAAEYGTNGDDVAYLERAEAEIGGDNGGEHGDAVGVEVLEGVGSDEGGGHDGAFGAGLGGRGGRANAGCLCHGMRSLFSQLIK